MSKKLAEDLTGLVLDVKRGSGAFLPELERGLELARTMIELGADHGCPVVALVTAMDRPLGRACGNALEVEEAIHALRGEGPPDLMRVTYALGAEMLLLAGVAQSRAAAWREMEVAISSGRAAEKMREIIEAQGGNRRCRRRSSRAAAGRRVRAVRRAAPRIRRSRRAAHDRPRRRRARRRPRARGGRDRSGGRAS